MSFFKQPKFFKYEARPIFTFCKLLFACSFFVHFNETQVRLPKQREKRGCGKLAKRSERCAQGKKVSLLNACIMQRNGVPFGLNPKPRYTMSLTLRTTFGCTEAVLDDDGSLKRF